MSAWRRAGAEALGTAFLLAAVVGSGIMGERLAGGNVALALLANALATGFALVALIIAFAPRSGAHFNPVVSAALALRGEFPGREVAPYVAAQLAGALLGVLAAHAMFELPLVQVSARARDGLAQGWSEVVATAGLVFVVLSCDRERPWAAPFAVGGYITAAYWFTASTSFANPAVTLARGLTDTFAGIRPQDVMPFVLAQVLGAGAALLADRWLRGPLAAGEVVEQPLAGARQGTVVDDLEGGVGHAGMARKP
jgi:glycerol uptake facilitator-like aquaporin